MCGYMGWRYYYLSCEFSQHYPRKGKKCLMPSYSLPATPPGEIVGISPPKFQWPQQAKVSSGRKGVLLEAGTF